MEDVLLLPLLPGIAAGFPAYFAAGLLTRRFGAEQDTQERVAWGAGVAVGLAVEVWLVKALWRAIKRRK